MRMCEFLASISFDTLEEAFGPESLGVLIVNGLPGEYVQLRREVLSSGSYLAALPEEELGKWIIVLSEESRRKKIFFFFKKNFSFIISFVRKKRSEPPPFFFSKTEKVVKKTKQKQKQNYPLTTQQIGSPLPNLIT